MDLIFRNFCCQHYVLRIEMAVILRFFIEPFTLGIRRTPNQTDNDVACSRSGVGSFAVVKSWEFTEF